MPNEFVARNGIIALNNSIITGSLTVTGGITGSFQGTASFATTSSNVLGGAANYIPLWNGATTLSSSVLYQSSGNIGIGTTSPSQKLDIAGYAIAGVTDRALIGQDGTYSGYSTVGFGGVGNGSNRVFGSSTTADGLYLAAATGRGIRFRVNGTDTDNMIINSSGNVGIGTTSPAAKLHIKQLSSEIPLILDNSNGTSGSFTQYRVNASSGWEVGMAGSGDSYKWFFSYGTFSSVNSKVAITNAGNVGIGTTSPSAPLMFGKSVYGAPSSEDFYRIKFEDVGGINNDVGIGQPAAGAIGFNFVPSTGYIMFNEGTSNERMRIAAGGNVGIGTTSPQQKLVVSNAGGEGIEISPAISSNTNLVQSYNRSTSAYNTLVTRASDYNIQVGTTAALFISSSGNIGINTITPTEKLTVRGNGAKLLIEAQSDPTGYYTYLQTNYDAANPFNLVSQGFPILGAISGISPTTSRTTYVSSYYDLSLHAGANPGPTGSNSALFISSSRNIGIGTTTPNTRLSVVGNVDLRNVAAGLGSNYGVELSTNSNTPRVSLVDNGTYTGEFFTSTAVVGVKNISNAPLTFGTNNTERARFTADGNLLIGTTVDVSNKLVVRGTSRIANSDGTSMLYVTHGASTGNTYTEVDALVGSGGGWGNLVFQSGGGNVGIGTTSPNTKLDVNGNAIVSGSFTVVTGSAVELQVTNTGVRIGNAITDNHPVTGSLNVTGSATLAGTFTQTPFKSIIIRSLSASATQAREFEILRGITDFNDWSETGVVEIEVHEQQWGRGLKKTYSFSYGYFDAAEFKLIEMIGSPSSNNFQLRMGSKTFISGEVYYYPVYAQVRYYGIVDIIVKTRRNITTNPVSTTNGDLYVNTAPTASNISDFTADTTVTLNNAASAIDVTGSFAVSNTVTTQNLAVNGTNATFNSTNTTINSTNIIVGNDAADLVGIAANTMYFPGNGRVGIGTTNPASRFFVRTAGTGSTVHGIGMDNGAQQHTWYLEDHFTSNYNIGSSAGNWKWTNSNGTLLSLTSTGNMGIGTTSPTAKLQVHGNTIISGSLNVTGSVTAPSFVGTASFAVSASWAPGGGGSSTVEEPIPAGAKLYLFYNY